MKGIAKACLGLSLCLLLGSLLARAEANPHINYLSPLPGSAMNKPETNIIIRSITAVDASTVVGGIVSVTGSVTGPHVGTLTLSDDGKTLLFTPAAPFGLGEHVSVVVRGGLRLGDGEQVAPFDFDFTIARSVQAPVSIVQMLGMLSRNAKEQVTGKNPATAEDSTLPPGFPSLSVLKDSTTSPGSIFLGSFPWVATTVSTPYLIIAGNSGRPDFYRQLSATAIDFDLQPNGHLTYFDEGLFLFEELDSSYNIVNSYACGNGYNTDLHELKLLRNGHALLIGDDAETVDMSKVVPGGDSVANVVGIIVQELDAQKNVVFQWRSWDHFKITDATHEDLTASQIDYVHSNALDLDADGNILLSSRHLDEITKIDRTTGAIIWRMGGKNNEFTFVNDTIGFSHQHDIRRLPNGDFTMFDNGNYHTPAFSRAIEYQVDEANKTATLVWQYRNNPDYVSVAMGDVQRLANGNTFIGWGACNMAATEVTSDGSKLYELSLPDNVVSYRALRYDWEVASTTGVAAAVPVPVPAVMMLNGNYPNPFNPVTKISFSLPATAPATLKVYNLLGQEVTTLVDGIVKGGVIQTVSFDGSSLASGVYFYRLASGPTVKVGKMLLIK